MPKVNLVTDVNGKPYSYAFLCPGCNTVHQFRVAQGTGAPTWVFSGTVELPTFSPSLRVYDPHSYDPVAKQFTKTQCHLNLENGKLIFHTDSPHRLAGQTVECPEWNL